MTGIHFHDLQHNLSEIYAALHVKKKCKHLNLAVASSSLYFQGCLSGKFINFLNKIWSWICPARQSVSVKKVVGLTVTTLFDHAVHTAYDTRQKRIWNHMREIDQMWKNVSHPPDLKLQRERYAQFLSKELHGSIEADNQIYMHDFDKRGSKIASSDEIKIWRHTIVNFHQATHLFWSLFVKNKDNKSIEIKKPLMNLLQPYSTLIDPSLYKALKKEGRWMQIEGVMQEPIPVSLFAKLNYPQTLTISDNKRLKMWVQNLNQCGNLISVKLFSSVLHEIINVIHLQGSSSLTMGDLLLWLDQEGCKLIHREDSVHMDWREKLCAGDTIDCNGQSFILGPQISPEHATDDTFKVFELKNHPDYVVKIANNRLLLLLEAQKSKIKTKHWGFQGVATIENLKFDVDNQASGVFGLDEQGCSVVLEKLSSPFDSHIWSSSKMELSSDDEKNALVFANHLFCMSQWKATPENLSLAHLMWDKNGVLKSTRLLKKGEANYHVWEAYAESAAKGNLNVLNFLMRVSGLHAHKMQIYYRKAVEHTLKTGETDLIGRPLPIGHRQEIYNQHVKKLCSQAQEIRQNCLNIIVAHSRKNEQYTYQQEKKLQQKVAGKLLEIFRVSPTSSRFLPDFQKQVVASFIHSETDEKDLCSLPDPIDFEEYYEEKRQLLMDYNQSCLSAVKA